MYFIEHLEAIFIKNFECKRISCKNKLIINKKQKKNIWFCLLDIKKEKERKKKN